MRLFGQSLKSYIEAMHLDRFEPRFPWFGPDLQTIRNSLRPYSGRVFATRRIYAPIDVGALSIAVDEPDAENALNASLLLIHGLGGDEASSYMLMSRDYFLAQGYTVYRLNYRGVGPGKQLAPPPYSAGLTSDIRAAFRAVVKDQKRQMPIVAMGFSLGGQLLLRTLGEGDVPATVQKAVTVSAPLDLANAQVWLARPRNKPYMRYVVRGMRQDLDGVKHPAIIKSVDQMQSVWDFDEHVIAPFFGFKNADDYYAKVSCMPLLKNIQVPTLAIHAADDTWIPVSDYETAIWPDNVPAGAIVCDSGGHVGFHGKGSIEPWYLTAAQTFLKL